MTFHELTGRISDNPWADDRFNHNTSRGEGLVQVLNNFVSVTPKSVLLLINSIVLMDLQILLAWLDSEILSNGFIHLTISHYCNYIINS